MSDNKSDGEQSEDGELRQSPEETKNEDDCSMSEEGETRDDGLDIKPPQARMALKSRPNKRTDLHSKGFEKHRDDRYSHKIKRHRSGKDGEGGHYRRDKHRYYGKKSLEQLNYEYENAYRDKKQDSRLKHTEALWKNEEENQQGSSREVRYSREVEKPTTEHYKDAKRSSKIGKALKAVLMERLIKRGSSSKVDDLRKKEKSHRNRKHKEHEVDPLRAGQLVRELISLTSEARRRNKEKEDKQAEEERTEQEQRREKLLEAERAMARLKEQSLLERKRRHLEKALGLEQEDIYMKTSRREEPRVITLSDNSDLELGEIEEDQEEKSDASSGNSNRSRSVSRHSDGSKSSYESDTSRDENNSAYSPRNSGRSSSSLSKSRTRSLTPSHNNHRSPMQSEDEDMVVEMEKEKNIGKKKMDEDLPAYYPALRGCRSVEEFHCLNKIDEGTYGVVYRARDKRTEDIVALKRLKMEREKEGFPITSLREINTLLKGQHPNIVTVREIVVGGNLDNIFIVMDYVEHDLKSLMETMRHKKQTFMPGQVKCLLKQLLIAMEYLHDNWILHRDLKTSNLLLSHKGILKVGDFGLAREYGSPLKAYTPIVVTRWYRAPELLLCTKEYSTPIDMWSVGCIFAELILMNALFPGQSEVDQLNRIFKLLGTPSEKIWSGFNQLPAVKLMKFNEYPVSNLRNKFRNLSEAGLGLLIKFLTFDPAKRITAEEALKQAYFTEPPLPTDPEMFPTWPAKSELGVKRPAVTSPKPPSGGGQYKKLGRDDEAYGFRIGIGVDPRREGPGFSLKF